MSALPFDLSGKVPLCTLANLRTLLGRSAARVRLISALCASTGSLQWAANHYNRDQFSESASSSPSSSVDAVEPQVPSSAQILGGSFRSKFASWPFELVMIVASFIGEFRDLISFSSCNKQLRHAIILDKHYVEKLWGAMLESNRYTMTMRTHHLSDHLLLVAGRIVDGPPASLTFYVKPRAPTESAFVLFRYLWQKESNRDCLVCSSHASIVPSIYGFPSPHLLDLFRKKKLVFGGDNLVDGLACWACLSCREQFFACPWTCGIIRCGAQDQTVGRARYQGRHALPWSFGDSAKK